MSESGSAGRVVTALVGAGLLDPERVEQATSVVEQSLATTPDAHRGLARSGPALRPRLAELAGYAGAALVVAAVFLLGVQYWADIEPLPRSLILVGITAVLLAAAAVTVRVGTGGWTVRTGGALRARYFASTLTVAAAVALAFAIGSYLFETRYAPPDWDVHNVAMTVAVAAALLLLVAAYLVAPTALLQVAMAVATVVLATSVWLGEGYVSSLWRGLLVMAVAGVWLALGETRTWHEPELGGAVGALLLLLGAQLLLGFREPGWAHAATFSVALLLFGLYWWRGDWPYLAVGVLALTISVTEALVEWTDGSLGAGGAVLVAGLTLLAASGGAIYLRRRREHGEGHGDGRVHPRRRWLRHA